MNYDFDEVLDRRGTGCTKWDNLLVRMGTDDALPLWVADCDFKCSQPIQDAVLHRARHPAFGYSFVPPAFFEVTRDWVLKRHGWRISTEDVRFFPGVVPFLGVCLRAFTRPGDEVLIQSPVYHPFAGIIRENGRVPCSCPLSYDQGRYSIDFDALDRALGRDSVRMMLFCNPHNPVGRVYTLEELRRVSQLCCRHGVLLVSDEIHSDVVYPGHRHIPIASVGPEAAMNTITCISPSKAFNMAGLKASGIIIINPELRDKADAEIARVHVNTPNAFAMAAYLAAYGESEDYLDQMVAYLAGNVRLLDEWLKENTPKIKLVPPEGTYLMWLDCSELGISGDELHQFFLRDARIALNKGAIFGPEGADFARMNIACPASTLKTALGRLLPAYRGRF